MASWLSRHGHDENSATQKAVLARCDTLKELLALRDADFADIKELKLGTQRALQLDVSRYLSQLSSQPSSHLSNDFV